MYDRELKLSIILGILLFVAGLLALLYQQVCSGYLIREDIWGCWVGRSNAKMTTRC
jgi:hypothetical protein